MSDLALVPVTLREARRFVGIHHRHNLPPRGWRFGTSVECDGCRVGVAVAGQPVSRTLDDGLSIEVTRVCTDGTPNANSMLYAAICRAADALGYSHGALTYTLASEPGSSLRAAGWVAEAQLPARGGWDMPSRPRVATDLFGNPRTPTEAKLRWACRHRAQWLAAENRLSTAVSA